MNSVPIIVNTLLENRGLNKSKKAKRRLIVSLIIDELSETTKRTRNRISNFMEYVTVYSDNEFKFHFRLSKNTFEVADAILMTLMLLVNSHFTYRMLADRFDVSESSAYVITSHIIKMISELRHKYIKWPQDYSLAAYEFNRSNGCIDCTHVEIPGKFRDNSYLDRNQRHSIILQAVCDSGKYFTDVYAGWPGSVHDARVWSHSPLLNLIESNELIIPPQYHMLGDSAYPLSTYLLTPFKNSSSFDPNEARYNYIHSRTRNIIERTFGLLKMRFRRLLAGVETRNVVLASQTIVACCVLHSLCLSQQDYMEIEEFAAEPEVMDDFQITEATTISRIAVSKRNMIMRQLQ